MRTFVLLFVLALPALVACGAAHAKTSSDLGKPICSHYDDASKSTDASAKTDPGTTTNATSGTIASPTAVASTPSATKGGGSSGALHQHGSPRWQAFFPGMFR